MVVYLKIELFSGLRIVDDRRAVTHYRNQKTATLLAFLAYHRDHAHPREALIEMLWPWATPSAGRQSLSQALSWLRHQLEPFHVVHGSVLLADRNTVRLNPETTTTDVAEFESALTAAEAGDDDVRRAKLLASAISLYTGELLPGFYEPWIPPEAERLAERYTGAVETLTDILVKRRDLDAALMHLEHAIGLAPLREELYRRVMQIYMEKGEAAAALAVYAELEQLLREERGERPSAATEELVRTAERQVTTQTTVTTSAAPRHPVLRRWARALPGGTVTLLAIRVGDGASEPGGDGVLRAEFRRHAGVEIEAAATEGGVSHVVAFGRASDAISCAAACQAGLGETPAAMAVDTQDVALGPDGTYSNQALESVLRLLAATNPSQILYSEAAAGVIRHGINGGLRLKELGSYRLRGADCPERIYQLDYLGGPDDLPPQGAESGYKSHLPLRLTRFFGREREMLEIETLLSGDARLVTLVGGPGCGKTRLAIETASQMIEKFAGRVWFVPLADLREGADILDRALDPLGIARSPQAKPLEQIVASLADRSALIIFDNFEHLLSAAGDLDPLLDRLPGLRCLVTLRRRLGLPGEHVLAVASLPISDSTSIEELLVNESIQLLLDRAQTAQPHFRLAPDNSAAVADLCRRLEGVPLAIELAAARLNVLTPAQILERLGQRDFLTSRARDEEDHHRSLHAAVEWSYSLLSPALQRFLARLSVFRGGWTVEAAETVCEEPLASDYLAELTEYSLAVNAMKVSSEPRFGMLEVVRQFAAEALARSGEKLEARRRHFDHFHKWAHTLSSELIGPQQAQWLERTYVDIGNFLAVVEDMGWEGAASRSGSDHGDCGLPDQLCTACNLQALWSTRNPRLGLSIFAVLLRHDDTAAPAFLRANARMNAGGLAIYTGDYSLARQYLEEGLAIRRALGPENTAGDLNNLAAVAIATGDYPYARTLLEEALDINRQEGTSAWEAINLNNMGELALAMGDHAEARRHLEPALRLYNDLGNRRGYAMALGNLGEVAAREGNYESARRRMEGGLALFRELGAKHHVVDALAQLATLEIELGNLDAARMLVVEVLDLIRELDQRPAADRAFRLIARIAVTRAGTVASKVAPPLFTTAARLEGAAGRLREALSTPIPPAQRQAHDKLVAELRAALGEASFNEEWEEGRALPFAEALACARALMSAGPSWNPETLPIHNPAHSTRTH